MKKLLVQIFKFVGISGCGWLLDVIVYTLLGMLSSRYFVNNCISSFIAVTMVFSVSTRMVFKDNGHLSLLAKYLIYGLYEILLIYLASKGIEIIVTAIKAHIVLEVMIKYSHIIAKILVTPFTMACNFVTMKLLVEKL